ncbi:MAG: 3-dehydroquinate synthase [Lentisphaeria bacterium]|nr:3-dehydroquinate synthase [Lentisphaeria bacterium]
MKHEQQALQVALGRRSYPIHFDGLARMHEHRLEDRVVLVVADSTTSQYGHLVEAGLGRARAKGTFVFPAGESSKTLATAVEICQAALRLGCGRDALFIALGGGVTGDLTGFAASIYMRGVEFWQVPTSLLAMVDSSVGGKTGVDLPDGKNLLGTFHQPSAVFMETAFLQTLPPGHVAAGMAEVIKYGVALDGEFFACLERGPGFAAILDERDFLLHVIRESCRLKAEIVTQDELESRGTVRELLNFGHTFGHAFELLSGYRLGHGQAVAWGMTAASRLAVRLGLWSETEASRLQALLVKYHLGREHCTCPGLGSEAVLQAMRRDKKNRSGRIRLVLPRGIGRASVAEGVEEDVLLASIQEVLHD